MKECATNEKERSVEMSGIRWECIGNEVEKDGMNEIGWSKDEAAMK